jgi:hypothetical protein
MTCPEIKDRLVDYLYGELPEAERQGFEAHLADCTACRQEVDALGATLARTRQAVRTSLDEPPPRVRGAVLAAARAAQGGASAPLVTAADAAVGAIARLLAWLRRPWVLPAFAAASVMAVFVFARRTIVTPERPAPSVVRAPAPVARPEPVVEAPAQPASRDDEQPKIARARQLYKEAKPAVHRKQEQWAHPPPAEREGREQRTAGLEEADRVGGPQRTAAGGAGAVALKRRLADDPLEGLKLDGLADKTVQHAEKKAARPTAQEARPMALVPPATVAAPRGTAAASRSATRPPVSTSALSAPSEAAAERAPVAADELAPAPAASAAPSRRVAAAAPAPRPAEPRPASPPAAAPPVSPAAAPPPPAAAANLKGSARPAKAKGISQDELVRRADRAFADRRFAEAATAYRQLLQRFPGDRSTGAWRARLASCQQALGQ